MKTEILRQPEVRRMKFSVQKATVVLIDEALQARRAILRKGPKLK